VLVLALTLVCLPGSALAQTPTRPGPVAGGEGSVLLSSRSSGVEGGLVLRSLGGLSPMIGATFLGGDEARLGAGTLGIGLLLGSGRLGVRPFGKLLLGRLEAVADSGGYHTADGQYHPYRRPVAATSVGGGGGIAVGWMLSPGLTLEGIGRYLATQKRERWASINGFYAGLGLRYLLPGARPAPAGEPWPVLAARPEPVPVVETPPEVAVKEAAPEPAAEAPPRVVRLSGTVIDGLTGRPLAATVQLAVPGEGALRSHADDEGRFTTASVPVGVYDLEVSAAGYAPTLYHAVPAKSDGVLVLRDIPLVPLSEAPAMLTGRATSEPKGRPLAGARVALRAGLSPLERTADLVTLTDAEGRFTFDGLQAGIYTVEVVSGPAGAVVTVTVPGGRRTELLVLPQLPEGGAR
jgi:hypothetical protein